MHATCHAHLIFRDLVTRKKIDEEYKLRGSSLSNFLLNSVVLF
jgi:hypothetical protein